MPKTYQSEREPLKWFRAILEDSKISPEARQHVLLVFDDLIVNGRQTIEEAMLTKCLAVAYTKATAIEQEMFAAKPLSREAWRLGREYRQWAAALFNYRRQLKINISLTKGRRAAKSETKQPPLRQAASAPIGNPDADAATA